MNNFDKTLATLTEAKGESTNVKAADIKAYLGDGVTVSKAGTNCFKVVATGSEARAISKKMKGLMKSYPQLKEVVFKYMPVGSKEWKEESYKGAEPAAKKK